MVDQSELAFRQLGRKYGCDLCYTPMLHSRLFSQTETYRKEHFRTDPTDRPLVTQFCANNPATLLAAARFVEHDTDAVDLNFGCPQVQPSPHQLPAGARGQLTDLPSGQDIAKRGRYGAFLMDEPDRVHDLVLQLKENLAVPVCPACLRARYAEARPANVECIRQKGLGEDENQARSRGDSSIRTVAAKTQAHL